MKWIFLLLLAGCAVEEFGSVHAQACPCPEAYAGFEYCAFFESDSPSNHTLLDDESYEGVGIPIAVRGYMHHKFCFSDTHAVFGSANPTVNGLDKNDNLIVHIQSQQLAENFRREYEYLLGRHSGTHEVSWMLNNKSITHLFCPRDSCEDHIVSELSHAQQSIVFLAFSFTSSEITRVLLDAEVCVQGVVEHRGAAADYAAYPRLREAGVSVWRAQTPGTMHHKAFLIDNTTAIIGSYNPSKNANTNNAETVLIISEPNITRVLYEEFVRITGVQPCKPF